MPPETYTIDQLADMAGLSRHTIRSYVVKGLLPTSENRGPNATYGRAALDRLRLILLLRDEPGQTLDSIRLLLDRLTEEQTREWAQTGVRPASVPTSAPGPAMHSALDYIRAVRSAPAESVSDSGRPETIVAPGHPLDPASRSKAPARVFPTVSRQAGAGLRPPVSATVAPSSSHVEREAADADIDHSSFGRAAAGLRRLLAGERVENRARGEARYRIEITPDIELNIRGPLTPEQLRSLCRVADHLRHLLQKGLPL